MEMSNTCEKMDHSICNCRDNFKVHVIIVEPGSDQDMGNRGWNVTDLMASLLFKVQRKEEQASFNLA